jgi:hypothetical protein
MTTKYRHLSDMELIRLVQYTHGDLVEELCARLEALCLQPMNLVDYVEPAQGHQHVDA